MKKYLKITQLFLSLILILAVSCNSKGTKQEKSNVPATASLVEVNVTGMTCAGCENTVQTSVAKIEGVRSVKASAASGKAIVEYTSGVADTAMIRKAIVASGYGVKGFNQTAPVDSIIK
jgi:mercuric ion transport protein